MRYIVITLLLSFNLLQANTNGIGHYAKQMGLYAGTKATIQWERVFSSQRRLKKHKLDTLSTEELKKLKLYLITHAADSNQPIVPGL